ncbi:MAG: tripartite tricarboxylate transporter substrate binding protein [Burkholderiales bacterium]|nr:tripartite tricarboxylate transporter substrate binding protein [Burkholderiales bacterium]MCW5603950.1 tripartite tricarboxylate transporter substrate binding protein [Burkholderiales bacterium]
MSIKSNTYIHPSKRHWQHLAWSALALALLLQVFDASAQNYPRRPVTIVVPFPPGAATDSFARAAGRRMGELLGQQFIIDNRSGASGRIGTDYVARAAPDGYTLLWGSSGPLVISPVWGEGKPPYDTLRDFAPISVFAKIPFILVVHPSVPATSLRQLLAVVKSQPGKLTYASSGVGGTSHLAGELFKSMANLDLLHVPYKGTSIFATELIAGQVDMAFAGPTTTLPHLESGRMRPIAITSTVRSPLVPKIPTLHEAGVPNYEFTQWYALLAPAKVPGDILAALHGTLLKAMDDADVKKRVTIEGGSFAPGTPEQFSAFLREELDKNARMIKAAGLRRE